MVGKCRHGNDCHEGRHCFTHRSRETIGITCNAGPHREALVWLEVGGSNGEIQARAFIMVSLGRSRRAGQSGLGCATLNNFSALWGIGGRYVSGTSPRVLRAGGQEFSREGGGVCGLWAG